MSDVIPTIKIKPSHPSQGDFVEINEADFDEKVHELYEGSDEPKAPSHGLNVAELKAALEAKGIEIIPEGAKKADLAALLDAPAPVEEASDEEAAE